MAVFNNSILTTGGNELIVEAAAGCQIEFTRLVTGSNSRNSDFYAAKR